MSQFRDTLMLHGWWLRSGDEKKNTHLFLDGGKAHVPDDAGGQFLSQYALAVVRKDQLTAVEIRTPVFRLFMDFDIRVHPAHQDALDLEAMWKLVQKAALAFFAQPSDLVVCSAAHKHEHDPEAIKIGIHLYWPQIYVNTDRALAFRETLLPVFTEAFGTELFVNSWEEIMDACVFKGSGLRMPWSSKGRGEDRAYMPTLECTPTLEIHHIPPITGVAAVREWMHKLTIRCTRGEQLTPLHDGIDVPTSAAPLERGEGTGTKQRMDAYQHLLPRIEQVLPPEYTPQHFTGMFRTPHNVMLKSTSRYCRHVGREHKSNTVYFVIDRHGITQRCFDPESCKGYESEVMDALDQDTIDAFLHDPTATTTTPAIMRASKVTALPSQKKSISSNSLNEVLSAGVRARAPKNSKKSNNSKSKKMKTNARS